MTTDQRLEEIEKRLLDLQGKVFEARARAQTAIDRANHLKKTLYAIYDATKLRLEGVDAVDHSPA